MYDISLTHIPLMHPLVIAFAFLLLSYLLLTDKDGLIEPRFCATPLILQASIYITSALFGFDSNMIAGASRLLLFTAATLMSAWIIYVRIKYDR